jgi:hypothetical protein
LEICNKNFVMGKKAKKWTFFLSKRQISKNIIKKN